MLHFRCVLCIPYFRSRHASLGQQHAVQRDAALVVPVTMPTRVYHLAAGEIHLGLLIVTKPLPHHAHSGRGLVQEDVDSGGGGETGAVGDGDGDVVLAVVVALVSVAVDEVGEGHQVAVSLTGPDRRAVAGVSARARGLRTEQGLGCYGLNSFPMRN